MNNLIKLFTFLLLLTLIGSCAEKPVKPVVDPPVKKDLSLILDDEDINISQQTFNNWQANWRAGHQTRMTNDSLAYFNVQTEDLLELLEENEGNIDSTRFYLGMAGDTVHLMMVAMIDGIPNFNIIADYSKACPPYCDN